MKLLVSDFDGTFFDPENYDDNIKLINKFISLGNHFVIATGRNYESLKKDLKIKCNYYICNDGAYILDNNLEIIYKENIMKEDIPIIKYFLEENKFEDIHFDFIGNKNEINKIYARATNKNITIETNSIWSYYSKNYLNINSIKAKKEFATKYLIELTNYSEVIVIGDSINDIGMIEKFGGYLISKNEIKNMKTVKDFKELCNILDLS